MKRLNREFFNRDSITVAKELLGKVLVFHSINGVLKGVINETEAYTQDDPACHTFKGKTPRTEVMFGQPGYSYIYLIYGMYYCFNIVTEAEGRGCAVLFRSVIPLEGIDDMLTNRTLSKNKIKELSNGPGKLCQAFNLNKEVNNKDCCLESSQLYFEDHDIVIPKINVTPRIGISKGKDLLWRFYYD